MEFVLCVPIVSSGCDRLEDMVEQHLKDASRERAWIQGLWAQRRVVPGRKRASQAQVLKSGANPPKNWEERSRYVALNQSVSLKTGVKQSQFGAFRGHWGGPFGKTKPTAGRELAGWLKAAPWRGATHQFHRQGCYWVTSRSGTAAPPRPLLRSAASIKANISSVSSGFTGGTRVRKNLAISASSGP